MTDNSAADTYIKILFIYIKLKFERNRGVFWRDGGLGFAGGRWQGGPHAGCWSPEATFVSLGLPILLAQQVPQVGR